MEQQRALRFSVFPGSAPGAAPIGRCGPIAAIGLVLSAALSPSAHADLPDPTRPAGMGASAAGGAPIPVGEWVLTMTRISPLGRIARLNGEIVEVDDIVGEGRVVAIDPDGVIVEVGGRRKTVGLAGSEIRRASTSVEAAP